MSVDVSIALSELDIDFKKGKKYISFIRYTQQRLGICKHYLNLYKLEIPYAKFVATEICIFFRMKFNKMYLLFGVTILENLEIKKGKTVLNRLIRKYCLILKQLGFHINETMMVFKWCDIKMDGG